MKSAEILDTVFGIETSQLLNEKMFNIGSGCIQRQVYLETGDTFKRETFPFPFVCHPLEDYREIYIGFNLRK